MTNESVRAVAPLSRVTWQTQAVLEVLLDEPGREVWPHGVSRQVSAPVPARQILRRLERVGWLVSRREPDGARGCGRVMYRLVPGAVDMARVAVAEPVRWPAGVSRRRPAESVPYLVSVDYPRRLIGFVVRVAVDGRDPVVEARALPPDGCYPATRAGAASLALWMLGARPGTGVEPVVRDLFG